MIGFIEDQRAVYGVESICRVLPIAPSTYYHRLACQVDPAKASARHQRDTELRPEIKRVWDENYQVYGVRKAWHQLKREGFDVARCTVERLMKQIGIRGAVRGKVVKTTIPDTSVSCPRDKVNRVFRAPAPNLLWVSDFTYVSTWQGFVYVAFVIDTFADRIVGWRVSRSAKTDFVLDALEQALHDRRPVQKGGLVHHSDRGGQGGFNRTSQHLYLGGVDDDWKAKIHTVHAGKIESPGRPPFWQRENLCRYWLGIAAGLSSEEAGIEAGVFAPVGSRWFRSSGGMPPTHLSPSAPRSRGRNLSFAERASVSEARAGIGRYLGFYTSRRPHSSLDGKTPDQAYFNQPMPGAASTLMKSVEVNWLPWSVLKIPGVPWRASASSTASMQKPASSVIDTGHARTRRVNKSSTAAR